MNASEMQVALAILQIFINVVFLIGGYARFVARISVTESRVNDMWKWFVRSGRIESE